MKKIIYSFILFLFIGYAHGQSVDQRLKLRFSDAEITQMMQENLQQYNMLVYAIDHGMYVTAKPSSKSENLDKEIVYDLQSQKNFLELGFEILNRNQYFPISGSDKMLVLKSEWVLLNEMKNKK